MYYIIKIRHEEKKEPIVEETPLFDFEDLEEAISLIRILMRKNNPNISYALTSDNEEELKEELKKIKGIEILEDDTLKN